MKLHEARKLPITRNIRQKWRDALLKFRRRIIFTPDNLAELRSGLDLGQRLELPFDLACNYQHLGDLFAADGVVRPFNQMTYVPPPPQLVII